MIVIDNNKQSGGKTVFSEVYLFFQLTFPIQRMIIFNCVININIFSCGNWILESIKTKTNIYE